MNNETTIIDFEQWLYKAGDLEEYLGATAYIDLVSISFKDKYAANEVLSLTNEYLDDASFETWKLNNVLDDLITKNKNFENSLKETYHLYCQGYKFISNIGIDYGLTFLYDTDYLSANEMKNWLYEIHPAVKQQALQLQEWLNNGVIVLTGKDHQYIDNRHLLPG